MRKKIERGIYNPDWKIHAEEGEIKEQIEEFQRWAKEHELELDVDTEQQYNEELGLQFPPKI